MSPKLKERGDVSRPNSQSGQGCDHTSLDLEVDQSPGVGWAPAGHTEEFPSLWFSVATLPR